MSPGTSMAAGATYSSSATGRIVTAVPCFSTVTPNAASIFSVWSRDVTGSTTVVGPSAKSPASRMADFTCALATGLSYVMPWSFASGSHTVMGSSVLPLRPTIFAPICESGWITRPIGRRESEASPVKTALKGCGARRPMSRRSVVPELPASRMAAGSCRPCRPCPVTTSSVSETISTSAPSAFMQATVERQSAAWRKFVMRTGVRPRAENMTLRCETDLSPGMRRRPERPCVSGAMCFCSILFLLFSVVPDAVAARRNAHRERRLQVVAAREGIDVDELARKIKAGHEL